MSPFASVSFDNPTRVAAWAGACDCAGHSLSSSCARFIPMKESLGRKLNEVPGPGTRTLRSAVPRIVEAAKASRANFDSVLARRRLKRCRLMDEL
jgi:hypothetical protein